MVKAFAKGHLTERQAHEHVMLCPHHLIHCMGTVWLLAAPKVKKITKGEGFELTEDAEVARTAQLRYSGKWTPALLLKVGRMMGRACLK